MPAGLTAKKLSRAAAVGGLVSGLVAFAIATLFIDSQEGHVGAIGIFMLTIGATVAGCIIGFVCGVIRLILTRRKRDR